MSNNVLIKRSSVQGKVPLTSSLQLGELALNTYDGNLFFKQSPNGVDSIVQVATLSGTQTLSNKTLSSATFSGTTTLGGSETLITSGSGGSEGGELHFQAAATNSTLNGPIAIDIYQNKMRIFETGGTNRGVYIDLSAASASVGTNLVSAGGSSTVSSLVNGSFTASLTSTGQLQLPVITQGSYTGGTLVSTGNVLLNAGGNIWKFGSDGTLVSPYNMQFTTTGLQFPDSTTQTTAYTGNAATATKLATARTLAFTGDATASGSFDGSANYSQALTLATVNSNIGTFGSSTLVPVITVNAKGLITSVSTASVSGGSSGFPYTDAGLITDQINTSALVDGGTIV